ncbi:MAG: trigger factor [Deltaproteobacteria bacterium]|nr:trigger factor [Deltaproteobacteria bacterium]
MQSQIKPISPVLYDVTVEIPWEEVSKELETAYRKLQQNARIRGFRTGKVPLNVVRQMMGKSVKSEVRKTLVQESLSKAIDEHALELIAIQEMSEPSDVAEGMPLSFNAKFEVRPKIESIDISGLEVEKAVDRVSEEIVDKEIERLREQHADLIIPDPIRPSRKGDILTLDYTVTVEGELKSDLGGTDRQLEIGTGRLLRQLDEGLLELRPEEEKTIAVDLPDNFARKELQGVKAEFAIVVKEIRERKLPELDDEFAKDLSYESMQEMKAALRKELEQAAQKRADSSVREKLVDLLIDKNPVPIPPTLLEKQEKAMRETFLSFQQYAGLEATLDDETGNELRRRAERKVRGALLLGQIARDQKMEITDEDVEQRLEELAKLTGKHVAKLRADYSDRMRENLVAEMMEEKLMAYLLSKATIRDATSIPSNTAEEETNP